MLERRLRYFMLVEELGSFTRASLTLHVSQPALSQQIRQLEESLGCQLLDRTGRRITATDAGKLLLEHARKAQAILDGGLKMLREVSDLSVGSLSVGYTPTFGAYLIGPLVQAFHAHYPGISLNLHEAAQDDIETRLIDDKLDLGIGFSLIQSDEIDWKPLHEERFHLMAASGYAQTPGSCPVDVRLIANSGLALLKPGYATRDYIDRYFRQHSLTPKIVFEANTIAGLIEVVRRSDIPTILPHMIALEEHDRLVTLPLIPQVEARRAALLRRRGAFQSAASKAFEDLLGDYVAQLQSQ